MEEPTLNNQRTALCVDDDIQLRPLVGQILERAGFAVTEAATCAEGTRAFQLMTPTVVVLDVDLPDGNGFEMAKSWRSDGHGLLPILFISGGETSSCQTRAAQLNASFLSKPFGPETLLAAVDSLLKG